MYKTYSLCRKAEKSLGWYLRYLNLLKMKDVFIWYKNISKISFF